MIKLKVNSALQLCYVFLLFFFFVHWFDLSFIRPGKEKKPQTFVLVKALVLNHD